MFKPPDMRLALVPLFVNQGDVILQFDGKDIVKLKDLPRYVSETAVGQDVVVNVVREGKQQSLHVTLGFCRVTELST